MNKADRHLLGSNQQTVSGAIRLYIRLNMKDFLVMKKPIYQKIDGGLPACYTPVAAKVVSINIPKFVD